MCNLSALRYTALRRGTQCDKFFGSKIQIVTLSVSRNEKCIEVGDLKLSLLIGKLILNFVMLSVLRYELFLLFVMLSVSRYELFLLFVMLSVSRYEKCIEAQTKQKQRFQKIK